jgi:hypothetical protein
MPKTSPRKCSWQCLDLAFKIQTKTLAQKLVLIYLAKSVNESLSCYPSYGGIMAHLGIESRSTVSSAIQYLRDDLHLLKWKKGSNKKGTANTYMFDLTKMTTLVHQQGIFRVDGTRITPSPTNGLDGGPHTGLSSPIDTTPSPIDEGGSPIGSGPSPMIGHQGSVKQLSEKELSVKQRSGAGPGPVGLVSSRPLSVEEQARQAMRQRRAEMRGAQ